MVVALNEIKQARERIAPSIIRTPTLLAPGLGRVAGGYDLHLKAELFQKTGSFKVRGALNKVMQMPPQDLEAGLVTMSAGNFAAALALAASEAGTRASIVMPSSAQQTKIDLTRDLGGDVILTDGPLMDRVEELKAEHALAFVHPFDDEAVIAGNASVGLEILEDVPDVDVVVVSIGGGGLISGVATAIKALRPETLVYGVEPEGANSMALSLAEGKPVSIKAQSIADGLNAPFAGVKTLEHVQEFVDDVVTVTDEQIIEGLRLLVKWGKIAPEPAGAAAFAAIAAGKFAKGKGLKVVAVISGGNMDLSVLGGILTA